MNEIRTIEGGSYRLEISGDSMTATLRIEEGAEASAAAVISKLKEGKIIGFDDGELIEALQNRGKAAVTMVLARGKPPVDERPGKVDFRLPMGTAENGLLARVSAGQVIAIVTPPANGTDGKDVFGATSPHKKAAACSAGKGASLNKTELTATIAGNARIEGGVVSVHPLLEIQGHDETSSGAVNFAGDVVIRGCLRDGRSLQTTGCLIVGGTIEAADFNVGEWVHVKGGIVGRDKGSGVVGGDLRCRFADAAHLVVTGNVTMHSESTNSKITCGGRLTVANGTIVGGEVMANGGVVCHSLGNAAGRVTTVEAGADQTARVMLTEARAASETDRQRITNIRQKIAPLMQHLKNLTPQQKEKATELLYEADQMEEKLEKRLQELKDQCKLTASKSHAEILVTETVFPGVVVRFPGVQATITAALMGPIRIMPRRQGKVLEVVVQEEGGKVSPLPSTVLADHFTATADHLTAETKAA